MHIGFLQQVIVPVPTGSNPLWLEKKESKQKLIKVLSAAALIILLAAAVAVARDYSSTKNPNASECQMGFSKTGCLAGYKCVGEIVKCEETGETYKYWLTRMILPEKKCNAENIYKEFCVRDEKSAAK